MQMQALRG
ncbi:hypothetical protein, conserved in T. vivax [Trypanosoma vivax Y486]|uniref:Uncharacterized protein n=1 Tax=Trypanosoma vivax (strain Y486) TaxID=1055687 RepID=F9WT64_TRYVY|nr:hypothetical protein, conserved in T. vivax [Trypanosoma vivax Y486]|eukprot:CCD20755.1 hypothetical protein, conserved in T. vivax [Trypanosoma vivax Y486]